MKYNEKFLNHFEHPQNVGIMDVTDKMVGTGIVGSPVCGDVLRLQIKINTDEVIIDAKFKTFGCGSAIASSSLLTVYLIGKTISEALKIKNYSIAKDLDLPQIKFHCSVLAEQALRAAIDDYRTKQIQFDSATCAKPNN